MTHAPISLRRLTQPASQARFTAALALLIAPGAHGQERAAPDPALPAVVEAEREWSLSLRWENDTFAGTDRFYTDGVSIALTHTGPSWFGRVADRFRLYEDRRTVGYDITQIMLTPEDTQRRNPDPEDRPYAGILTAGFYMHIDRTNSYHGFKVTAGVVGPWSLAEKTQREVHRMVNTDLPHGWDYQLENEPLLNLTYEHRRKYNVLGEPGSWAVEVLPVGSVMLGNWLTQLQGGGIIRAGRNIPEDFSVTFVRGMGHMPPPRRDAQERWGFAVHAGAFANVVLWDITLDGNIFHDSRSVDKYYFVPTAGAGVEVGTRKFLVSFTYVVWGREFKNQDDHSSFGAVAFSYFF